MSPGFEIHLQSEHKVERTLLQFVTHGQEFAPSARAIEQHDVINQGMSANESRRPRLQHPCEFHAWVKRFQCMNDWQHVYHVANSAHHHNANAIEPDKR